MLMKLVDVYLCIRRATGSQLNKAERHLRRFAHFATQRGDHHIKTATVMDWILADTPSQDERIRRLSEIIGFALFGKAEDARHQIPPDGVFGRRKPRTPPFIYSEDDIRRLVHAAAHLGPLGSLRSLTFTTLFALLAVTGLRISEALALRFEDVTADGLLIRDSKFHKSRWVPLHETTLSALQQYIEHRKPAPTSHS
jgi:integrase